MTAFEEIKKAMEGVTPGHWYEGDKWVYCHPRSGISVDGLENVLMNNEAQANIKFIVATQPERISELLSTLENLQRDNEELRVDVKREAELATHMASDCNDAQAEVKRLRDLLRFSHDTLWEINPSNYNHDDVCKLNDASVEVILAIAPELVAPALASTGGEHNGN